MIRRFLMLLVVMNLIGCDALYRVLDKEGAEEKELVGEIVPYERNPTIEEVQKLLDIYGYNPGKIDGALGRRTRDAIERFQKDYDLEVSRFVDNETWAMLRVFVDNELIVDDKLNIVMIQTLLKNAGYSLGFIDGKVGPKTKKAIMNFQADHDLKSDGKIGYKTLTVLTQYFQPAVIQE